jgi:sec-independent protein translocase protein TatA
MKELLMFGGFGLTELLVILAIVLLIFGPKRLKSLGSDLGSAIKGFRTAVTDEDKADTTTASAATDDPKVIEGEVSAASVDADTANAGAKQNSNV